MIDYVKARWKTLPESKRSAVIDLLEGYNDDAFEAAAALLKALSPQKTYPEEDGINALIRWRDAAALDWTGDDLVFHIANILNNYYYPGSPHEIPEEHAKGYQNYLKLSEAERIERITAVVNPESE